jgi:hypothetical protein
MTREATFALRLAHELGAWDTEYYLGIGLVWYGKVCVIDFSAFLYLVVTSHNKDSSLSCDCNGTNDYGL